MHINHSTHNSNNSDSGAIQRVLREAKRLHRSAISQSCSRTLPVLRRLISSNTLRDISLPNLFRHQDIIQRKHILHMLACEAGYVNWVGYKRALSDISQDKVEHYGIVLRHSGYPNIWFTSLFEAEAYSVIHGGQALAVGRQAVVIPCHLAN